MMDEKIETMVGRVTIESKFGVAKIYEWDDDGSLKIIVLPKRRVIRNTDVQELDEIIQEFGYKIDEWSIVLDSQECEFVIVPTISTPYGTSQTVMDSEG